MSDRLDVEVLARLPLEVALQSPGRGNGPPVWQRAVAHLGRYSPPLDLLGDPVPPTVSHLVGLITPVLVAPDDDGWRAIEPMLHRPCTALDVAERMQQLVAARNLDLAAPWARLDDRIDALRHRWQLLSMTGSRS